MAIAMTVTSRTATVRIDDSCCRGVSREEMARRWAEVARVAGQIARNHAARKAEEAQTSARGRGALTDTERGGAI